MRDVISIKSHAFNGDITKELYAPKASMIESMAFCNCDFGAVAFGALRLVGENPFYKCNTDWIRLGLSYEQAEMKLDETAQKWVPTEKNTGTYMTKETKVFLALHLRKYRIRNN